MTWFDRFFKQQSPATPTDLLVGLIAQKIQAEAFNREHGKYGRRSLIHAVKGFRSYDASALCRD